MARAAGPLKDWGQRESVSRQVQVRASESRQIPWTGARVCGTDNRGPAGAVRRADRTGPGRTGPMADGDHSFAPALAGTDQLLHSLTGRPLAKHPHAANAPLPPCSFVHLLVEAAFSIIIQHLIPVFCSTHSRIFSEVPTVLSGSLIQRDHPQTFQQRIFGFKEVPNL